MPTVLNKETGFRNVSRKNPCVVHGTYHTCNGVVLRTMEDGLFSWSDLMIQHPRFDFLFKKKTPVHKASRPPHMVVGPPGGLASPQPAQSMSLPLPKMCVAHPVRMGQAPIQHWLGWVD